MAIKDLAISYNASVNADAALCMAVRMCKKYDASLTGLYASVPVRFEGTIERWISDDVLQTLKSVEDTASQSIEQAFFQAVAGQDFEGKVEWAQEQGRPNDVLTRHSRYFDLMLMGQQSDVDDKKPHIRAEDIVTRSGKPLLIVPNDYVCRAFTEYAVVAWDGSRASARALTDAMQILETKQRLDVVTVAKGGESALSGSNQATDIIRHLKRHGIDARRVVLDAARDGKGATILKYCAETNPDVLVTGAYGHSRLREDLFGGVTQHIMRNMNVPVFMAH